MIANLYLLGIKYPNINKKKNDLSGKINLHNFLPAFQQFSVVNADYKCCIIRDPVERFLSTYRNRILYHKDEEFKDYTIDMILEKLEKELFDNIHFRPQIYFLGDNLNYYSFYANVSDTKCFEEKVYEFFGKKIKFPKLQLGGKDFDIKLSSQQINKIKTIYFSDFELLEENL